MKETSGTNESRRAKDQCPGNTQPMSRQHATCTEASREQHYLPATCPTYNRSTEMVNDGKEMLVSDFQAVAIWGRGGKDTRASDGLSRFRNQEATRR